MESRADHYLDNPQQQTLNFTVNETFNKNLIESVSQLVMKVAYSVVSRSRPHQARKADVILTKAL